MMLFNEQNDEFVRWEDTLSYKELMRRPAATKDADKTVKKTQENVQEKWNATRTNEKALRVAS